MFSLSERGIIILFLCLTASVTFTASALYHPVGADIIYHLDIVQMYLQGKWGMFGDPFAASRNLPMTLIPYPPLFHFFILPSVALGFDDVFLRVLQAVQMPLIMFLVLFIERKHGLGKTQMLMTGLVLLGSNAFVDIGFAVHPETFDAIFWLLLTWFLLENKAKSSIATAVAGIYNHSFASMFMNGGAILGTRNLKTIGIVALCAVPIVAVSVPFILGYASGNVGVPTSPQAYAFIHDWPTLTFYECGSLLLAFPVLAYKLWKWKSQVRLSRICILTVLSSVLFVPIWYDRFYAYASLPLAILLGEFLAEHKLIRIGLAFILVVFFIYVYGLMWANNLWAGWDVHWR